jgi:hypothetical protein
LKFYRIAGALASQPDPQFKCNSGGHAFCNGSSLPRDLYLPMQTGKHDLPQARVATRKPTTIATGSNPTQTTTELDVPVSVPAQDETWIEPPPVTQ